MNSKKCLVLVAFAAIFALTSCSGVKNVCTVNCVVTGNANVTLTLTDTPPAGVLFLNFNLPISSISLTPSGGGADVPLLSTPTTYETTHLQSDSTLIGTSQVAAGTYTTMNIFVSLSPSSVFFNGSGGTLNGCVSGAICNLSGGAPGKITIDLTQIFGASGLVLTGNENLGMALDFNLNNAITSAGGISLDLTQPNVFTASALPRPNQDTGTLDTVQGLTGIVSVVTSNTLTIQSPSKGTLTFNLGGNTAYTEVPNLPIQCNGGASLSCIKVGSIVSADADVTPTGTMTATVVDIIDITGVDEVEGTIYPTITPGVYGMIISDTAVTSGNTTLLTFEPGSAIYFAMNNAPLFTIDSKNLPTSVSAGFAGGSDLISGQQVRLQVASVTTFKGLPEVIAATAILRYATITASVGVNLPTNTVFYLDNTTINPFYGTFLTQVQVQAYSPQTIVDGVTGIPSLTAGNTVSISTLFLNPQQALPCFLITKVRKH